MKLTGLTLIEAVKFAKELGTAFCFKGGPWWDLGHTMLLTNEMILSPEWEVEAPKPKTEMRFRYVYITEFRNRPFSDGFYYKNDDDFLRELSLKPIWFERIEESGREFPIFD